ncbi:MAG: DinB family protein [Symbiobacteriaceae bacterium]|nr:MAG: glyoxalase [Bacillota bacterium]
MAQKPLYAVRVTDLERALGFYQLLGFRVAWQDRDRGVAEIQPPAGSPLLLARREVADLTPWMHDVFEELEQGRRLYLEAPGGDLDAYWEVLAGRGLEVAPPVTTPHGEKLLTVHDPDGNHLEFWQAPRWTDEELLAIYGSAAERLREALAGLRDEHLDLARAPGKWTIRQIVHHIADSDASTLFRILMMLAEPGRAYQSNPYDQDVWVTNLDHAHRSIDTSVNLIGAIRAHVTALIRHLPHGLDHRVIPSLGAPRTVRELVRMLASHALGHIDQIWETRRVHGV